MKTKKTIALVSSALLISSMFAPLAFAKDGGSDDGRGSADIEVSGRGASMGVSVHMQGGDDVNEDERDDATSTSRERENEHRNSSTTEMSREHDDDNATTTGEHGRGGSMSEEHQSVVAAFVHSLLSVADREGGIGAQVRAIAQAQEHSASTSVEAIAKVENRGSFRTLLLGSDYHSLGQLKAEIASTTANIAALKDLLAKATTDADKAELTAQIQALEDAQVKLDAFVQAHEKSFSLFGWFTKLFSN